MPEATYPTIGDVGEALEGWAPLGSAQDYDNVGLQVGDARRVVHRALIALDLTPAVLDEARRHEATLIVTHHPLLFHPLRSLTTDGFVSSLALRLAEAGIALYSIHTNLDAAPGGVSFALAEHLGLEDIRFLDPFYDEADGYSAEQPHTPTGLGAIGRPRMALIDAGHYETEAITESLLQDWLRRRFPTVEWRRTETRTSPMDTFIPGG